jgi:putative FmdB family regulatory protein
MPIYEYGCDACGHQLEVTQKIVEAPLKTCPSCGKDELHRLISATAFVLKGGGWYKDGYGSSAGKRTENQRIDRLEKAIGDDKKKSESSGGSSSSGSSDSGSSGSSSSGSSDSGSSSSGSSGSGGGSTAAAS